MTDPSQRERPVTLLGRGSRLVGGTITAKLTIDDVNQALLDGFFPAVSSERDARTPAKGRPAGDRPAVRRRCGHHAPPCPVPAPAGRAAAPSAPTIRRGKSGLVCPTHVLFNGGVMKAPLLRARVIEVLGGWLAQEGVAALDERHVLEAPNLDHAVAQGAAYYGMARRGRGVRIRSGASRSYYVGIETAMPAVPGMPAPLKALCVVPFGMEEGTSASIAGREFGLIVGEPAEFRFLSSSVRKTDPVGALIEDWGDELEELSPLEVTLQMDAKDDTAVPVTLESHVTEVGTLELWCVGRNRQDRWKLELNIRERDA